MALHSARIINHKNRPDVMLSSGQRVNNFHPEGSCLGDFCPVHKPSDHPLLEFPLAFTGAYLVRIVSEIPVEGILGIDIDQLDGPQLVAIDPDDYLFNIHGKAIVRNSAICGQCGEKIVSRYRHEFQECSCGASAVDGGFEYLRRSGSAIDTSIVFTLPKANVEEEEI